MIEVPPRKKSLIISTIKEKGVWQGRIDGQRVRLEKVIRSEPKPHFTIQYNFILNRKHTSGEAGTVWEAIDVVCDSIGKIKYGR